MSKMKYDSEKAWKSLNDSIWEDADKSLIERILAINEREKELQKSFDDFEMCVRLFEKEKVVFEMNKSKSKEEILRLWDKFLVLEKSTRIN